MYFDSKLSTRASIQGKIQVLSKWGGGVDDGLWMSDGHPGGGVLEERWPPLENFDLRKEFLCKMVQSFSISPAYSCTRNDHCLVEMTKTDT